MAIQVINDTLSTINIAINHWGKDGDTHFFKIKNRDSETWNRSSDKGFIMIVESTGKYDGPWYIESNTIITFNEKDKPHVNKGRATKIEF